VAEIEYETRDVNVRTVFKAGLALAMLAALGGAVSFGVYLRLRQLHQRQERPAAPLAQAPGRLPPIPRLQSAPQADLAQLRAQHLRELTSYGWINQQSGTVRIDVEQAMRLYVQRMAARPAPSPAVSPAGPAPRP
jgi:hypothetical protein